MRAVSTKSCIQTKLDDKNLFYKKSENINNPGHIIEQVANFYKTGGDFYTLELLFYCT